MVEAVMSRTCWQTDGINWQSATFDPTPKSASKPGHSSSNCQGDSYVAKGVDNNKQKKNKS